LQYALQFDFTASIQKVM